MFTRQKLDGIWSKFIAQYHRDFNHPLLIKAPTVDGGDGYSLWGGSIQQVSFNHQSGSRSGESHIVVICMPNTDGEHDNSLFAVSHFHHEGSSSEVYTFESVKQRIEKLSSDLSKQVEEALADPKLYQLTGKESWKESEFFFNMASTIYCLSMEVEIYSIMKKYDNHEEIPEQKPTVDEEMKAMQQLLSLTTDPEHRKIIQEEIDKRK